MRSESADEEFAAQPFGEEPLEGNKEVWAVQTTLRCVLVGLHWLAASGCFSTALGVKRLSHLAVQGPPRGRL